MLSPRLLADDYVVSMFPGGVTPEMLTLFHPFLTDAGTSRCSGRILLDRMDAMGVDPNAAMACLADALELASEIYDGLPYAPALPSPEAHAELDAFDWLLRLSFDTDPRAIRWLLSLVEECDPLMALRLCLMARPTATVRLELPERYDVPPAGGSRLVITQTRADAETLNLCLSHELPHLADLVRCTHLGGDESSEQLLQQLQGMARLRLGQPLTFVFRSSIRPVELPESINVPESIKVIVADAPDSAALLGHVLQTMGVRPAWHVG